MTMARSSTDSQHYSLKWNDYSTKMVAAFQSLRADQDFVDVTIACDSHHYEAHKMVLSACSPYFRSILKVNPCKHPIIILKDVSHSEMEKLLEFMYNGEVNIAQEHLPAFLKVAENLKIKGLAGSASEMEQLYNSTKNESEKSFNSSAVSNYSDNRIKDDIPNKPTVKKRKVDYSDMEDTPTTNRQIHNSILGATKPVVVLKNEPFDEYMTEAVERTTETDVRAETVYSDMPQDNLAPREDGSSVLEDATPHDNDDLGWIKQDEPLQCSIDSLPWFNQLSPDTNLQNFNFPQQENPPPFSESGASFDISADAKDVLLPSLVSSAEAVKESDNRVPVSHNPYCLCDLCLKCRFCGKSYSSNYSKKRHERDKHISTESVACDICGALCKNKSAMIKHRSYRHRKTNLTVQL